MIRKIIKYARRKYSFGQGQMEEQLIVHHVSGSKQCRLWIPNFDQVSSRVSEMVPRREAI